MESIPALIDYFVAPKKPYRPYDRNRWYTVSYCSKTFEEWTSEKINWCLAKLEFNQNAFYDTMVATINLLVPFVYGGTFNPSVKSCWNFGTEWQQDTSKLFEDWNAAFAMSCMASLCARGPRTVVASVFIVFFQETQVQREAEAPAPSFSGCEWLTASGFRMQQFHRDRSGLRERYVKWNCKSHKHVWEPYSNS